MSIPDWLSEIFAGVTLLVAAMSAGQLAVARAWIHRGAADTDITLFHLLLGIAMAGLLAADLHTLPNSAWDVVFAVTTAWFDWCLWRDSRKYGAAAAIGGQYAPQLTYSAAMLYMFTALAKPSSDGSVMSGMSGMPGQRVRLLPRPQSSRTWRTAELLLLAPAVVKGRRVALGVTTAFLLLVLM